MTDAKRPEDADELPTDDAEGTTADDLEPITTDAEDDFGAELDSDDAEEDDASGIGVSVAGEPVLAADPAAPTRPMSSRERRAAKAAGKTAPVAGPDDLPYIDDRVSKWWVGLITAVFALILLYGFAFGRGGLFTVTPSPVPSEPVESVLISPSPALTGTPRASGSPTATGTAGPSLSAGPSTSPAVSPATSPAASPATSPAASPATSPAASPATSPLASPAVSPSAGAS